MGEAVLGYGPPAVAHQLLRRLPDRSLARQAARGSGPAFAVIYQRHQDQIYRYCRTMLGNEHDARDALQNTMLRALTGLEGEQREIALRPWLFRIAHNESVSLIRARRRHAPLDPAEAAQAADSGDLAVHERLRGLFADLGQLSLRQRSALMMRELSGLEFGEIAGALETSPAGAKQAVYEARVALHELAEGRDVSCDAIRRKVSAEDRRLLRARRVRAHLRSCSDCRLFESEIRARGPALAAVAAPLPAPAALALLQSVLGGGATAGGIAGALGATAVKAGLAGVAALAVGAGALAGGEKNPTASPDGSGQGSAGPQFAAGSGAGGALAGRGMRDAHGVSGAGSQAGATGSGGPGSGRPEGSVSAAADGPATGAADGTGAASSPGAENAGAVTGGGGEAESSSAPGTPPGQGGTPPGQSGTPPGQSGTPPGQSGTPPGQSGTPPGQSGTPPGQSGTPPGQSGTPPGQSGTPPGQGGTPPGQSGTPPGQSGTPPGQSGTPPAQGASLGASQVGRG